MLFLLTLGNFWLLVVNSVTFSSNLSNFERFQTKIQTNKMKDKKNNNNTKKFSNPKKSLKPQTKN